MQDGNVVQACVGSVEGEKALYRLLAWKGGSFAFTQTRVSVAVRIQNATRALLMEGMRQLDEWERAAGGLPPLDGQVSLRVKSTELPNIVHPLTQEVLLLLEIYGRVQEVVDHCSYPDYQVLRTLQTLVERGIVQIRRAPSVTPAHPSEALFTAAQARRLREWTDSAGGRPGGADAKLLLLASDREAMRAFLGLFRGLPGAQLDPALGERGEVCSEGALQRLGRIPVERKILGIELIHVPALNSLRSGALQGSAHLARSFCWRRPWQRQRGGFSAPRTLCARSRAHAPSTSCCCAKANARCPRSCARTSRFSTRPRFSSFPSRVRRNPGSFLRSLLARILP